MANLLFLIAGAASTAAGAFYYMKARCDAERLAGAGNASDTIAGAKQTGWICASLKVSGSNAIKAPFSGKPCVYYRTQLQNFVYTKKSWKWNVVEERNESVPFELCDETGKIMMDLKEQGISPDANQTFSQKEMQKTPGLLGSVEAQYKKLEWAIASGETLTVFGKIRAGANTVELNPQFEAVLSHRKPEEEILEEKAKANSDSENARIFAAIGALLIAYGLLT